MFKKLEVDYFSLLLLIKQILPKQLEQISVENSVSTIVVKNFS